MRWAVLHFSLMTTFLAFFSTSLEASSSLFFSATTLFLKKKILNFKRPPLQAREERRVASLFFHSLVS